MLFTYVFGEKLDLSKFRKQATHYISTIPDVTYHLYLPIYKIHLEVSTPHTHNGHLITISIFELTRNEKKEIIRSELIHPLVNSCFQDIKAIQDIWMPAPGTNYVPGSRAAFASNSVAESVEKICTVLKIVHKIDHLKAFL
jgi:hypothetical protein